MGHLRKRDSEDRDAGALCHRQRTFQVGTGVAGQAGETGSRISAVAFLIPDRDLGTTGWGSHLALSHRECLGCVCGLRETKLEISPHYCRQSRHPPRVAGWREAPGARPAFGACGEAGSFVAAEPPRWDSPWRCEAAGGAEPFYCNRRLPQSLLDWLKG